MKTGKQESEDIGARNKLSLVPHFVLLSSYLDPTSHTFLEICVRNNVYPISSVWNGKTHCAASCPLGGSGNTAGCNGGIMVEREWQTDEYEVLGQA